MISAIHLRRLFPLTACVAVPIVLAGCGGGSDGSGSEADAASISGVIEIASGARVDWDYADNIENYGRLADEDTQLRIPVPATVGGFLSATGGTYSGFQDSPGRPYPPDLADRYIASVGQGDNLLLQVFPADEQEAAEVDLSVTVDGQQLCAEDACSSAALMSLEVPALDSQEAEIELSVSSGGPVRYLLTLAPQGSTPLATGRWPEPALVPGEAIVSSRAAEVVSNTLQAMSSQGRMELLAQVGPGIWHVRRPVTAQALSSAGSQHGDPRQATVDWIRQLRQETGLMVEPNYLVQALSAVPQNANPGYANPDLRWNLDMIRADSAWQLAGEAGAGAGVGVAVLDTGLFNDNPALTGSWHPEFDDPRGIGQVLAGSLLQDTVSRSYDVDREPGPDFNPATPGTPAPSTASTSFHGTHVAGIIAARDNDLGTVGVAHQANLVPYRVLGVSPENGVDGTGTAADLIAAINAAAGRSDVDVINLSLGIPSYVDGVRVAVERAVAAGKLVVAAAGNNGNSALIYPAANPGVVGVGSVNRQGALSSFSNFGPSVDLVAPGGEPDARVPSNSIYNAYGVCNDASGCVSRFPWPFEAGWVVLPGTSMAAPHVTGAYAIMKSVLPTLTQEQFRALLHAGDLTSPVSPDGSVDYDYTVFGLGLLDAQRAVVAAQSNRFPSVVMAKPRALYPQASDGVLEVNLAFLSPGPDTVSQVPVAGDVQVPDWLRVTDANGRNLTELERLPERLRVAVTGETTSGAGEIRIPYQGDVARELVIPVQAVAVDNGTRDAGAHYVLLLDDVNEYPGNSRQQTASYDPEAGVYRFGFEDVEPGSYLLVAGSDLDNNGYLCEDGEACAQYPALGNLQRITVDGDGATRVEMVTSFLRPLPYQQGLPQYGLEGYPLLDLGADGSAGDSQRRLR